VIFLTPQGTPAASLEDEWHLSSQIPPEGFQLWEARGQGRAQVLSLTVMLGKVRGAIFHAVQSEAGHLQCPMRGGSRQGHLAETPPRRRILAQGAGGPVTPTGW
jgi:hypothetical protein